MLNGGACKMQQAVMLLLGCDAMKRESSEGHGSEGPQKAARGRLGRGGDLERLLSETIQV